MSQISQSTPNVTFYTAKLKYHLCDTFGCVAKRKGGEQRENIQPHLWESDDKKNKSMVWIE